MLRTWFLIAGLFLHTASPAQSWERVGQLSGSRFYKGAVSPTGDIYLVSLGIHRSSDSGATWRQAVPGVRFTSFYPTMSDLVWVSPDTLFMALSSSLIRSTDGGNTWNTILATGSVSTVSNSHDAFLAVGTQDSVAVSPDRGASWEFLPKPVPKYEVEQIHLDWNDNLYAETADWIYRTSNFGQSWYKAGLPYTIKTKSLCSPKEMRTLVGVDTTLYLSSDKGNSWKIVYNPGAEIMSIVALTPDTLFLHTTNGIIHRSTNSGTTWSVYSDRFRGSEHPLILFCGDHNLYVLIADIAYRHDVRSSTEDWQQLIVPNATVATLVAAPSGEIHGYKMLAVSKPNQVVTFKENTWSAGQEIPRISDLSIDSSGRLCTVFDSAFHWSIDGGNSWMQSQALRGNQLSIANSKTSIFVASDEGVYRSTNTGASFFDTNVGIADTAIRAIATVDGIVYAGGREIFYRSSNNGEFWEEVAFPFISGSGIVRSISCRGPDVVVGVDRTGVYFSNDYGLTWENHSEGLPGGNLEVLLTPSGIAFANTAEGIFEYSPESKTWEDANHGILGWQAVSMTIATDGKVYVSTLGDGVYRSIKTYGAWVMDVKPDLLSEDVSIFPNPASTQPQLSMRSRPQSYTITIYNLLGQSLLIMKNTDTIDISTLRAGQYFVRIATEGHVVTLPLVVSR